MAIQKIYPPQIEEFLPALACPKCHGPLLHVTEQLLCMTCSLHYPIIDSIPVLIAERAIPSK